MQSTDTMQFLPKFQAFFIEIEKYRNRKNNFKIHMKPHKTSNSQGNHKQREQN